MQKTYAGFGLWVISNIAVAVGVLLLGFDSAWTDLLGTSLTFGAVLIGYEGNRRFLDLEHSRLFSSAFFVLQFAGLVYFKFFDNANVVLQIVFTSFLVGVISLLCGLLFAKNSSQKAQFSYNFTAVTYIVFALVMFSRSVITFYTGDRQEFYRADGIQPLFFILYILFEIVRTFNYINLNTSRMHNELKQTQEELEKLATTDFLTGISNRRSFLEIGEGEIQRARRFRHPLSLIMFDIDFFKRVNDLYGHAVGDSVLVSIADVCRKILRVTDTFGRLGGEEFGILLPHTNIEGAKTIAEYIRAAAEESEIKFAENTIKVTASFGITEISGTDAQIISLLDRTDILLYKAKNEGRNRIFSDTEKKKYKELAVA